MFLSYRAGSFYFYKKAYAQAPFSKGVARSAGGLRAQKSFLFTRSNTLSLLIFPLPFSCKTVYTGKESQKGRRTQAQACHKRQRLSGQRTGQRGGGRIDNSADAPPYRSGCVPDPQICGQPQDKGAGTGERATNGCEFVLSLQSGNSRRSRRCRFPAIFQSGG